MTATAVKASMVRVLFRVLSRHAPSRLLTVLVAALIMVTSGLEFGVMFMLGVATLELGLWLDRYGVRK